MATLLHTTPEFGDSILPTTKSMKALVFAKAGLVELREKPIPVVGPTDALIKLTLTTICGTCSIAASACRATSAPTSSSTPAPKIWSRRFSNSPTNVASTWPSKR